MEDAKHRSDSKGETEQVSIESDQRLEALSGIIGSIENHSKFQSASSYELTNSTLKDEYARQAPVLRYIAAMIKSELKGRRRGMMVVAVALLKYQGEWRFIVAVNGNKKLLDQRATFYKKIPRSIGGISVDCLMDDDYGRLPDDVKRKAISLNDELNKVKSTRGADGRPKIYRGVPNEYEGESDFEKDARSRGEDVSEATSSNYALRVPQLTVATVWQWHAEQKLLRYVKLAYGPEARRSIVALGISKSPCTYGVEGANHCKEYLYRKWLRARSKGTENSVAAYWYKDDGHGNSLAPPCSRETLFDHRVDVGGALSHPQQQSARRQTASKSKGSRPPSNQSQARSSGSYSGQGKKRKHWQTNERN